MMNRRTIFFIWKFILTIGSLLFIIFITTSKSWNDIVYDLSICIFSAMILVWFIDEINKHLQDKKNKRDEIEKIKRSYRLLQIYIMQYNIYFYCLITPIAQRHLDKSTVIKTDFLLQDMQDLYKPTILNSDDPFSSSIECFIKAESNLINEMKAVVKEIDFVYYPDIQECLLNFIEVSLTYNNFKKGWINAKNIRFGKETDADFISKMLKDVADDWYKKFKNEEKTYQSNVILNYFALYEMLKEEQKILFKYKQEIEKLNIQ